MTRKTGRKQGKRRRLSSQEEWERDINREVEEREAELAQRRLEEEQERAVREQAVNERLERLKIDHEARQLLIAEITRQRVVELPEPEWTAADFIEEDDSNIEEVIEGLHYRGGNTLLVAEYKTGKTTLQMNLAAAIADGEPFLGKFDVYMPKGRVAMFNYEMDERQFRQWLREANIENVERIVPLNLRGRQLPFWDERYMLEVAEWLFLNEVGFLIIDPAAKAWRGLVEQEGDNVQLSEFFGALDELKRLADVSNLLISAHTPRSGDGRARGGGEIEAWPDANWYLGKDKDGVRTLRAEGRDVDLPKIDLEFDEETRRLVAGGESEGRNLKRMADEAVSAVEAMGEVRGSQTLCDAISGPTALKRKAIAVAVDDGRLVEFQNGRAKHYKLKGVGR